MADKENIPTLTTVIQQGDPGMLDHFDMQKQATRQSTPPTTVENASSYENEDAEEIPSLHLENEEEAIELPKQDFSEAMQQRLVEIDNQSGVATDDSVRQSIDEAIAEVIPQIEAQLRKSLYKKFGA